MSGALPGVTVVVPVRDDAEALRHCLDHLARQTVRPLEVVVVDNGSSDHTAAVARAGGARVVTEPRVGIWPASAAGYDAARGDVLARCDADSRPGPRWVERIARRFGTSGVDAVTGWGRFYDLPHGVRGPADVAYLGSYYLLTHLALGHTALWGSSMALRRTTWEEVRDRVHPDRDVHDDMDLAFALGPRRRIRFDPLLTVGVSARSLRGRDQRRRRLDRARRTLEAGWAVSPPWERWHQRLGRGRRAVTGRGGSRAAAG